MSNSDKREKERNISIYIPFLNFLSKYSRIRNILIIKYNKKLISYICDNPMISIFILYKWKEVLQYLNTMVINLLMIK